MSAERSYKNAAQQRVLRALSILAGNEVMGVAPTQLSKALRTSASNVTRDLFNLCEAGFAERLDNGNYRLGPRLIQISLAHSHGLADIKARVDEIEQRYSRTPN